MLTSAALEHGRQPQDDADGHILEGKLHTTPLLLGQSPLHAGDDT